MSEVTLLSRIETAIAALEWVGEPLYHELHPDPSKMSKNERHSIIYDHTLNLAKLQMWLDVINDVAPEDRSDRMNVLDALLNRRLLEAATIIMSVSLVN